MIGLCMQMAQLAMVMDNDRKNGVTIEETRAEIDRAPANVREIARSVVWYVYEVNDDHAESTGRIAERVRVMCEASTHGVLQP